jgi:hypothetical protein
VFCTPHLNTFYTIPTLTPTTPHITHKDKHIYTLVEGKHPLNN